jgi:hypothetical protein
VKIRPVSFSTATERKSNRRTYGNSRDGTGVRYGRVDEHVVKSLIPANPYGGDIEPTGSKTEWYDWLNLEDFMTYLKRIEDAEPELQPVLRANPAPALIKTIRKIINQENPKGWSAITLYNEIKHQHQEVPVNVIEVALFYLNAKQVITFHHWQDGPYGRRYKAYRLRKTQSDNE